MDPSADASSTSRPRLSRRSPPSGPGSSTPASPGESGLGLSALRDLASRHGIRPSRSLGQHFLADPNLARAIVADAGVAAGDRVLEVGAGLGSLTVALAAAGAEVLAVEFDRTLIPALQEVVAPLPQVRLVVGDALRMDLAEALDGSGWKMVSNLPYGPAVSLLVGMLDDSPQVVSYLVMVQREVGERLVAGPGDEAYGAVSLRIAYRAHAALVRRVPPEVFWPRPKVESVLVRLTPRPAPVDVDERVLFRVVEVGFAERRKTMSNALRRLGLDRSLALRVLEASGVAPNERPERLGLAEFAKVADVLIREGVRP